MTSTLLLSEELLRSSPVDSIPRREVCFSSEDGDEDDDDDSYESAVTTAPGDAGDMCGDNRPGVPLAAMHSESSEGRGDEASVDSNPIPPELKRIAYPNIEFMVTKWHHKHRWLKQTRVLRLQQHYVENALNKPVSPATLPLGCLASAEDAADRARTPSCFSNPEVSRMFSNDSLVGRDSEDSPGMVDHYGGEHRGCCGVRCFRSSSAGSSGGGQLAPAGPNHTQSPTRDNGYTTKRIPYSNIEGLVLVEGDYFIMKVRNDHDYHYLTRDAVRIVWEIQERINAYEARCRYYSYAATRVGRSEPSDILKAFRLQKLPSPLDSKENLLSRQRESLLELHFLEVLLDAGSKEGTAMRRSNREIRHILQEPEVAYILKGDARSRRAQASDGDPPVHTLEFLASVRELLSCRKTELLTRFLIERAEGFPVPNTAPNGLSFATTESEASGASRCTSWDDCGSMGYEILNNTIEAASLETTSPIRVLRSPKRTGRGRGKRASVLCNFTSPAVASAASQCTEDELIKALDCALQKVVYQDRTVTDALYLLLIRDTELKKKRMQLKRRLAKIRGKPPQFFGVPSELSGCGWDDAIRELDALGGKLLPCQKLDSLVLMMRQLVTVATTDGHSLSCSLDDILPLVLYCVSRCALLDPWAEAEFMAALTDPSSTDERAYYLTVFISALEYLRTFPGACDAEGSTFSGTVNSLADSHNSEKACRSTEAGGIAGAERGSAEPSMCSPTAFDGDLSGRDTASISFSKIPLIV
eukprot:TRINITY_DN44225_c0_g1_i1.p1 TRINITY_DN44225_c0_g1~~TRINITY_DN44225_c0_g1_i1.p1  ORF type:complete len:758 (+),score=260.50 TRINITY_DN44225_c0_g1_i1:111-2384(+)